MRIEARWWACAAAAIAAVFGLLLAPIGLGDTQLANAIENAAHGPLFAGVAIGAMWVLRRVWPRAPSLRLYVLAWLIAFAVGGLSEAAQWFSGRRDAELKDWLNDGLGALAGLAAFAAFDTALQLSRAAKTCVLVLGVVALTPVCMPVATAALDLRLRQTQLPALISWHSKAGHRLLTATQAEALVTGVPEPWREAIDERALYVQPRISPLAAGSDRASESWPGVTLEEPWPNWRAYRALAVDLINPNDSELALVVRVNDWAHNGRYADRFNRGFRIAARQRVRIVVPLDEIERAPDRRMDMGAIAKLVLFQDGRQGALPFYLCAIRLE